MANLLWLLIFIVAVLLGALLPLLGGKSLSRGKEGHPAKPEPQEVDKAEPSVSRNKGNAH
jgi:hypothetical protein